MSINKSKIKTLKSILEERNFYPFLCDYSSNEIDIVIDNLSKLINYVITSDEEIPTDLKQLLDRAVSYPKKGEYLIFATNSYLDNYIKLRGLDPIQQRSRFNEKLTELDHQISFLDYFKGPVIPLYGTIEHAITEGFKKPSVLYDSILKQPSDDKRPLVVGESEKTYYSSILQRRLKNVPYEYKKTGASIANKILKEIIGREVTLYFLPTDRELEQDQYELYGHVRSFDLRSIKIPSKYTLLMICARNKGLQEGTKLSIDTGEPYVSKPIPIEKKYSRLNYTIVEEISITDEFIYDNGELTGDISYDVDEMYGRLDAKHSRDTLSSVTLDEKIRKIKNSHDINVELRDGKYHITNGRHRIIFLKHFYDGSSRNCSDERILQQIKDMVTIPAFVNKTIEDKEIQRILLYLESITPQIEFFKVNIHNDKPDLVILCKNNAYHVSSKAELVKFAGYIGNRKYNNEFVIGEFTLEEDISYEAIITKMFLMLKGDFFRMDFMDIIRYLQNNPITIADEVFDASVLNYFALYYSYVGLINEVKLYQIRGTIGDIIPKSERFLSNYESERREQKKRGY